jgi:CRISPR-associated protein Cmr4
MNTRLLFIFTRTPLHVGAGASVGAIDQPVQRERHTGFPIIPASSLKGSFADQWNEDLVEEDTKDGGKKKVRVNDAGAITVAAWLFGSDSDKPAFAGSLLFSEARVLAFPIRSAKGSYAWITCPLMLKRAARDGVFGSKTDATGNANMLRDSMDNFSEPDDDKAIYGGNVIDLTGKVVLEEYCFKQSQVNNAPEPLPAGLADALAKLVPDDAIFSSMSDRLVILSNGTLSHFVTTACEVAQHVRISDETGTADGGALFNQENIPSETLFYSVLNATKSRVPIGDLRDKTDSEALTAFKAKIDALKVFQFGGDASTGLGFCSVALDKFQPNS